jgi:uncharacterized protein YyaL (SSP411 family)
MVAGRAANRLAAEPSLYLRQHAHNPVDWFPWGEEALVLARETDRPILLSVGYSSCHWCHVMAHESFDDESIAALMNAWFVCVKVDREERPDVDATYMRALQAITGRGGWPMTVFLTPELQPFYAGTYFPPIDRGGLPGFARVLRAVSAAYGNERERVRQTADRVIEYLSAESGATAAPLEEATVEAAARRLESAMDDEHGGFGTAPKFPSAACLELLLALESAAPDARRRACLELTFDRMAGGGFYDQLGGGFHRYSVDRRWLVPHFEKMLYDQAVLIDAYRVAWLTLRRPRYREIVLETAAYACREMQAPEGGFYASQDADSGGEEGGYFLWSRDELEAAVGGADAELVATYFGVTREGHLHGRSVLHRACDAAELSRRVGMTEIGVATVLDRAGEALRRARSKRPAPTTDRKVLTDWNGLMIHSLAAAGQSFDKSDLIRAARRAADFVLDELWSGDSLLHFHDEGQSRVPGFLDDHALLGRGLLALSAATGQLRYAQEAIRCADALLAYFRDPGTGAFLNSRPGTEVLIPKQRTLSDGAVPAGNSVAIDFLYRLHCLTGDGRYAAAADDAMRAGTGVALQNPYGGATLLTAFCRLKARYTLVVVLTDQVDSPMTRAAIEHAAPHVMVMAMDPSTQDGSPILPIAEIGSRLGSSDTAFVCRSGACSVPVTDAAGLRLALIG